MFHVISFSMGCRLNDKQRAKEKYEKQHLHLIFVLMHNRLNGYYANGSENRERESFTKTRNSKNEEEFTHLPALPRSDSLTFE